MLGKLLTRVGEDRVLWGTDAIWYGSPQPQIMAFRAFQITPEFQERFGYPALTDEIKRKVFGLNAARCSGLDPDATTCAIDPSLLATARACPVHLAHPGRSGPRTLGCPRPDHPSRGADPLRSDRWPQLVTRASSSPATTGKHAAASGSDPFAAYLLGFLTVGLAVSFLGPGLLTSRPTPVSACGPSASCSALRPSAT